MRCFVFAACDLIQSTLHSFLDNIERISEPDYVPTTGIVCWTSCARHVSCGNADDILNVRLQTLGVIEHSFEINMAGSRYDWKLYDVGGAVRR